MTAVQSAYTLSSDLGGKAWLHACPFDTNFERSSVECDRRNSEEYNWFFPVISFLSSYVFERKTEPYPYLIVLDIVRNTSWEDHTVSLDNWSQTITQMGVSPENPRPLFDGDVSAAAAAYDMPRHFEESAETATKVREDEATRDARSSKREIVTGMIERLSGPSRADLPCGPELTEHGKKYGAAMDMADALAHDRQVDAKYAARERARKSKKLGNRRA